MTDSLDGVPIQEDEIDAIELMEPEAFTSRTGGGGKPMAEDLPEPLYRIKLLHSNETFFAYFVPTGTGFPHFHSLEALERLMDDPTANKQDAVRNSEAEDGEESVSSAEKEESARPGEMFIPDKSLAVAPTKYGKDLVEVQGRIRDTSLVNPDDLVMIERPASLDDIRKLRDNLTKETYAYEQCRDRIWARNLPMKLVSAHYLLEEPKILFYFTAETRVDFRELVKDLVSLFKIRIELRQIGVRDEARVCGGCGVCGRVLCCNGISDKLNPVSIKMAKDQNLSLNSLKISGPCGRLLCCLSYEYQFYKDARRELPQEGIKFIFEDTQFRVVEVNALTSTVRMAGEDGRVLDMKAERFRYSEGRWKIIED